MWQYAPKAINGIQLNARNLSVVWKKQSLICGILQRQIQHQRKQKTITQNTVV